MTSYQKLLLKYNLLFIIEKGEWSISPGSISPHQVALIWRIKNNFRDKHQVIYK